MEGTIHKRPAVHAHPKQNEIYVSRNTTFPVVMKRAETLLFLTGLPEIHLHGLGACIPKTIQVAAALQQKDKSLLLVPTTSTVPLVDDHTSVSFFLHFTYISLGLNNLDREKLPFDTILLFTFGLFKQKECHQ